MPKESIVDASVPSAGRIYDYLLGGHHNFQVDRMAADRLMGVMPFLPKLVRLQRWCLQDIAYELTAVQGFDVIVDFASGLPTQDHLHTVVPEGTTVIYSDYDPVVVEYAREILGDSPDIYFFEADARHPEDLLNRSEVQRILHGRRDIGIVTWGISAFLADTDLMHISRFLNDWTGGHAIWAFNAQGADVNKDHPAALEAVRIYQQMGTSSYPRSRDEYLKLITPWEPDERGLVSLLKWHGLDSSEMSQEDVSVFGPTGAGYGAYLWKPR